MANTWLNNAFTSLPATSDDLFRQLWTERRLVFAGRSAIGDDVDSHSARLVCSTLNRKARLLLVLPDFKIHRVPLLFATALLRHWYDCQKMSRDNLGNGPVLYFGATVGIRNHLRNTGLPNLTLADVFPQQDVTRTGEVHGRNAASGLPKVITVYSTPNPVALIHEHKPSWIAIDCGDASCLTWLRPLLTEAARRQLPVIAWSQNHLSPCITEFTSMANGYVFTWPSRVSPYNPPITGNPDAILYHRSCTSISPLLLSDDVSEKFSAAIREAMQMIACGSADGRFQRDALSIHWRLLRSMEALSVPFEFYEAESAHFWGLRPYQELTETCKQFRQSCSTTAPQLYIRLEQAALLLENALKILRDFVCPLWRALCDLCTQTVPNGEARLLVFPSDSRKQLFVFALLARFNLSEEDVHKNRIWITSLNEFHAWMFNRSLATKDEECDPGIPSRNLDWHIVLAGLPSPTLTPKLLPVFMQDEADIFLYPHQYGGLSRRCAQWASKLGMNSESVEKVLGALTKTSVVANLPAPSARIELNEAVSVNVKPSETPRVLSPGSLWQTNEAVDEIASLFEGDDGSTEDVVFNDSSTEIRAEFEQHLYCAGALNLKFERGWSGTFALDEPINVIIAGPSGRNIEQRFVRSLKVNDIVLIIHDQQRQNLYDLIISRVHNHASIELHLALIRRWQEELRVAYQRWIDGRCLLAELDQFGTRDLSGLLRRMKAKGSTLASTQALTSWLRGWILCPEDTENLRRIGDILEMRFVRQYHHHIAEAAKRLRGIHRGLSMRLNHWVEDQARGAGNKTDNDVLDSELGLTFGDLRNSLLILRVKEMQPASGLFLRERLGKVKNN